MGLSIWRLLAIAAIVRTAYLGIILLLGQYLDDYDSSVNLTSESCEDIWPEFVAREQLTYPLVVWDSVFLHRIAACGYEYEQYFAFFPGLTGLIRLLRTAGMMPTSPMGFTVITLTINNAAFLLSVVLLAKLSQQLLQDDKVAATAVLVFIVSPASIHHSMLYTEALFTATSWMGLYFLYCSGSSLAASLAFAASAATRSNGLLNAGFILHEHGRRFLEACYNKRKASAVWQLLSGAVFAAVAVAPYFAYMLFGYKLFCTGVYGGDAARPWCSKLLPSAYGYVQDVYWNVGLFRYYEIPQIPNFLLASPTLIMSIWGALAYACACPHHLLTGGLLPRQLLSSWFRKQHQSGISHKPSTGSNLRRLGSSGGLRRTGSSDGSGCLLRPASSNSLARAGSGGVSRPGSSNGLPRAGSGGIPRPGSSNCLAGPGSGGVPRPGSSNGLAKGGSGSPVKPSSGSLARAGSGGVARGGIARAGSGGITLARLDSGGVDGSCGAGTMRGMATQRGDGSRSRSGSQGPEGRGAAGEEGAGKAPCMALPAVVVGHASYCGWAVYRPVIPGVSFESLRQRQESVKKAKQLQLEQMQQGNGPQQGQGKPTLRKRTPFELVFGQQQQQQQQLPPVVQLPQRHSRSNSASSDVAADDLTGVPCSCAVGRCFYSPGVAVYVIHWALLTAVCLVVVHIQVATRFLSSCVPLYWFAALLMLHKGPVLRWLLWWYCFAFMGVGAVFFTNFYPWT